MESLRQMSKSTPFAELLADGLGGRWSAAALHASGFCETWRAEGPAGRLFVKAVPIARAEVLEAEADGLAALSAIGAVRVPAVVRAWRDAGAGQALLAMEWLDLGGGGGGAAAGARLGEALGALHRVPPPEGGGRYGWRRDNLIGGTPQRNRWSPEGGLAGWLRFYADERLGALSARLAALDAEPALLEAVDAVVEALPRCFDDGHVPRPSLIHGDLWSGNRGFLADGTPVLYDPAVSCSDAEAELAMMELFGAPPPGFFEAYRRAAGLHAGYRQRRALYQLYHLLNHALLFGGGYGGQALRAAREVLARSPFAQFTASPRPSA